MDWILKTIENQVVLYCSYVASEDPLPIPSEEIGIEFKTLNKRKTPEIDIEPAQLNHAGSLTLGCAVICLQQKIMTDTVAGHNISKEKMPSTGTGLQNN